MTLLFEAAPDPALPVWQRHSTDLDQPRTDNLDHLTYLNLNICPRCCENVGSAYCRCDWSAIAGAEQAGTPVIHIDMKGRDGG